MGDQLFFFARVDLTSDESYVMHLVQGTKPLPVYPSTSFQAAFASMFSPLSFSSDAEPASSTPTTSNMPSLFSSVVFASSDGTTP